METTALPVFVGKSRKGLGKGLFAARSIEKGEYIAEYTGTHIPTPYADTLKTRYLFEIDAKWTIDGSSSDNVARYINHACMPNCEAQIESGRVHIFALRDIFAGEEFTIDYGDEYFDEFIRPVGCKCDACILATPPSAVYSRI